MEVVKIYRGLRPWKLAACPGSFVTVELSLGKALHVPVQIGDTLEFGSIGGHA
jgi:uncharacterized membrane protein (UPF0127 family)